MRGFLRVLRRRHPLLLSLAASIGLAACGEGTGPGAHSRVGLGFQVARTSMASSAMIASAFGDGTSFTGAPPTVTPTATGLRITRDADVLLITKAQLVVRHVKLKNAVAVCTDDDDDCPSIRVGPFLVDVPINGTDGARIAVPVPAGSYSSVRLSLHKVTSSDSADTAFRLANPTFTNLSVRLEGTFNGVAFVFTNDVDATLDVPLTAPLVIGTGGGDVTVSIDFSTWFLRPAGGLYGPALANAPGAIRAAVQNNIRAAFRAFRDDDRDGRDD